MWLIIQLRHEGFEPNTVMAPQQYIIWNNLTKEDKLFQYDLHNIVKQCALIHVGFICIHGYIQTSSAFRSYILKAHMNECTLLDKFMSSYFFLSFIIFLMGAHNGPYKCWSVAKSSPKGIRQAGFWLSYKRVWIGDLVTSNLAPQNYTKYCI